MVLACILHSICDLPPLDNDTIVLPGLPPFAISYDATTNYYFPLISELNITGYIDGSAEIIDGPFGFDEAIQLQNENQCVVKSGFQQPGDNCVANPKNCNNGISFSIWERVVYGEEVLNVRVQQDRKYIFSTGGDTVANTSYPGLALYHEGIDLIAVVSTGDDVWYLRVTGQLVNQSWSNIGVMWEPFNATKVADQMGGLEMYVNLQKVGHAFQPLERPGRDVSSGQVGRWTPAPPQTAVITADESGKTLVQSPPYIMVGCHRRSDQSSFGQFSYPNSSFDEIAIWTRELQVNRTVNEVLYFTGGYVPDFAGLDTSQWSQVLDHVRLDDPGQAETAAALTQQFFNVDDMAAAAAAGGLDGSGDSETGSGSGDDDMLFYRTQQQQAAFNLLKTQSDAAQKLVGLSGLVDVARPRDLRRVFRVLPTASTPLEDTSVNADGWKSIQLDPSEAGSSELVSRMEKFAMSFMNSANTTYPESYPGLYSAARQEMLTHATSDAMVMSITKVNQSNFKADYGDRINLTSFFANHPVNPTNAWEKFTETVEIPTTFYFLNSTGCSGLPVTLLSAIYDGYGHFAPLRRNPESIRASTIKLDGRAISVKMQVGSLDGSNSSTSINCTVDTANMKYDPIRIRFNHMDPQTSLRKLLWHDSELQTDIDQRVCVVWNEDVGTSGGWDSQQCNTVITEQSQTVCECGVYGTFSVIAAMVEDPYVPPEMTWLSVVKYFGFGLSLPCLAILVLIIATSPKLHDMFHLLRMNAGISFFFALLFHLIAQSRTLCEDRHKNIVISALQQGFFNAGACFVCAEAYATFQAITSGIIGGKTWAFVCLSYGLPIINVGLAIFLYGTDYGKDPRCFIGWENDTKLIFFYQMLSVCGIALLLSLVIVLNMAAPRTRRQNALDQLASQGQGLAITVFLLCVTWGFGFPAFIRYPDQETADFWPIYIMLCSWFGLVMFVFLGVVSKHFRDVVLGWRRTGRKMYQDKMLLLQDDEDDDDEPNGASSTAAMILASSSALHPLSPEHTEGAEELEGQEEEEVDGEAMQETFTEEESQEQDEDVREEGEEEGEKEEVGEEEEGEMEAAGEEGENEEE